MVVAGVKACRPSAKWTEIGFIVIYVFTMCLFAVGMSAHSHPYHEAIDPVGGACYSPFGEEQYPALLFYALLFYAAVFLLWRKGNKLPPLTAVLSAVFVFIGIVLSLVLLVQLSGHNIESLGMYAGADSVLLYPLPVFNMIAGGCLLYRFVTVEIKRSVPRSYNNRYLNTVNQYLSEKLNRPVWVLLLLLPVLLICTLLLILFGQDADALVKVFTDTATWKFSQKMHPPVLDHRGHYLCTVAACGSPKLVKPIRLGRRGGNTIIVNRQLLIANAFEEWVCDISPAVHRIIRRNYDRYGYNLSIKINSPLGANLTYVLMKPLEWLFLTCLYLFCRQPERKIRKQYRA
ncbi:hypothetical protein IBL28_20565 [Sinomicrobium sp. FJxs]|uniref:Uncharacterized protein n=1 Tax=Sinomicrobium weinanense TaxID=2842200 RepID=A0A926JVJ9_9FLAO|nr:hypothetical protein [Sinomicrobium weinanense]